MKQQSSSDFFGTILHQKSLYSQDSTRTRKLHITQVLDQLDALDGSVLPHARLGVDNFDLKSIIEVMSCVVELQRH